MSFARLDVLDDSGLPWVIGGGSSAPGFYFVGYQVTLSGSLRDFAGEARAVARSLTSR